MMIFTKNTFTFNNLEPNFYHFYNCGKFYQVKIIFLHYSMFKDYYTRYIRLLKPSNNLVGSINLVKLKYKKNFLKIIIFLVQGVKRHGGSRWRNVLYTIKTRKSNFFFFLKKKVRKHNYYQKVIARKIKSSSIISYRANIFKYSYRCVKIQQTFNKYRSVFRSKLGDYIVTPLINCVTFGSLINYYSSFLKFFNRVTVGSFSTFKFFRNSFLISNIGVFKPKYSCSMGTYSIVVQKKKKKSIIQLPSNKRIIITNKYSGYLGRNAGTHKKYQYFGKASTSYIYNGKYSTRGVAKNPVDHPNGGRTRGKNSFKTPWGLIARKNK